MRLLNVRKFSDRIEERSHACPTAADVVRGEKRSCEGEE